MNQNFKTGEVSKWPLKESIQKKADRALKRAVRDLIKERRAKNEKIVIWRNGRVVRISAKKV